MNTILLIEDDKDLATELAHRFNEWDYEVHTITDFSVVLDKFMETLPNLVIIDVTLPKYDGFYWCERIRNISNVPILFLSSRNHPTDIVMSMKMGADDYIEKPFHFEVLKAKVEALLRRAYDYTQTVERVNFRNVQFDFKKYALIGETNIELTKNEAVILSVLYDHKDAVVSRDKIMNALWDTASFINDNTLTVNIKRLRAKLKSVGIEDAIQTKTGVGYLLKE